MKPKLMRICSMVMLLLAVNSLAAQMYSATDKGSSVKFVIRNFGFNVEGSFTQLKGTVIFDPGNLSAASFNVSVAAATINTGNGSRDSHLKKKEYFDVAAFPQISFSSVKIAPSGAQGWYMVTGNFTIKGKTRLVSFQFTATPQNGGYLLKGKTPLNRRDFEIGGSSISLSDNLVLTLSVLAQPAAK